MLTYPKSIMRVRRMPMHLSSGHVTLMPGKFYPPSNFLQSDLGHRADSRWALPQISRLFMFCYKFFVQREISEMRRPIGAKFCTMVSTRSSFIMLIQNFGGPPQKKFGGPKTCKIWPDFVWNGWRYSKSDFYFIYRDSSCVRWNKSGELWSSNLGDLDVNSYPPKAHFLEEHISAPRECYAPIFLRVLENHQVLLVHPPIGDGGLPYNFFQGGVKNWLKM